MNERNADTCGDFLTRPGLIHPFTPIWSRHPWLLRVLQRDGVVTILEQVVQFAELFRQVAAIDFVDVDQEDKAFVRGIRRLGGEALNWTRLKGEGSGPRRPTPFDEVLVRVGRVELDQLDPVSMAGDRRGKLPER